MLKASEGRLAVIVPIPNGTTVDERHPTIRSLDKYCEACDRMLLTGREPAHSLDGWGCLRVDGSWLESRASYSRLLLSREFYRSLAEFEFVLVCQLDALVLGGGLSTWCERGYDYIGAPWVIAGQESAPRFSRVGNGGFSLRRTTACLEVLEGGGGAVRTYLRVLRTLFAALPELYGSRARKALRSRIRIAFSLAARPEDYACSYTLNEDRFWADRAVLFDPRFRVAPVEVGLDFAFEAAPAACYRANGGRLPFGVHAWEKHDPGFWLDVAREQLTEFGVSTVPSGGAGANPG